MVFLTLPSVFSRSDNINSTIKSKGKEVQMKLIKRNGSEVIFDREKIVAAVTKANDAISEEHRISEQDIDNIALEVERLCLTMVRSAGVEEIQDLVEKEIMKLGAFDLAAVKVPLPSTEAGTLILPLVACTLNILSLRMVP